MAKKYDFSGWASRYDVPCTDGRTIRKNAFKDMDGQTVGLVWGHEHDTPIALIGNALIEHRDEGPYIYASFNETPEAQHAKEAVRHGDVKYLSIYANRLKEKAGNVMHGVIREVSIVYGGANPGAYIDHAVLSHSDGTYDISEDEAIIMLGGEILQHDDTDGEADKSDSSEGDDDDEKILNTLNDKQEAAVKRLLQKVIDVATSDTDDEEPVKHSDEEEEPKMKYNAFENEAPKRNVICHADQEEILNLAKDTRCGTFKNALKAYMEDNELQHDDEAPTSMGVGGFDNNTVIDSYGNTSFTAILPEFKDVRPMELITNDQGWIGVVMSKTHKSPISRIRTSQVDIRGLEALRAKGYEKGHQKQLTGQIAIARRETEPQTIYVRNELHRDDIVDITDFDYVQYLYNIDRLMLNEELATAIMLGDGREVTDADKIKEDHIRPIWTDDELFTIHATLDLEAAAQELQGSETDSYFGDNYITAEAMINAVLYAREDFKGSGQPDMFITPHMLNVMLLARDRNGRRIYSGKGELASALNVGNIYTAEQFANKTRTDSNNNTKKLHALIVNLADYTIGRTKGGEVTHFTQFDIDFNKQKSLLETRNSGALTRIKSAIAIEETVTA